MCPSALKPKAPKIVQQVPVTEPAATPTKSDADIQKASETERRRLGYSTNGFSSLIATSSFGDLTLPDTSVVSVNGY